MINQNLLLTGDDGYNLTKSLRFRSSASAYLNRTPASAGNQQKFTLSVWTKKGDIGSDRNIISFGNSTTFMVYWGNSSAGQELSWGTQVLGVSNPWYMSSAAKYRDIAGWYHIVIAVDTTQASSADRTKAYINGVQVTSFRDNVQPSQNYNTGANSTTAHSIGRREDGVNYLDGYLAEFNWIDGQALTPSSFGETDVLTGVWKPKKYAGTYGTNGFYLPFTDVATTSGSNAGLGKDFSGNGNYWNTNNISVTAGTTYDSMTDVPTLTSATTANYCVLNPLDKGSTSSFTFSDGNLKSYNSDASNNYMGRATIALSSGKWYWEATLSTGTSAWVAGILTPSAGLSYGALSTGISYAYSNDGNKYNGQSASAYGATYTTGDTIGVALDLDAGTLAFYKNGTSQGTAFTGISGTYAPSYLLNNSTIIANFGQRPFSYNPPTGFVALNTFNLPEPSIKQGNKHFNAVTWTGNGTSSGRSITGVGFQPDFVWGKPRSLAYSHSLSDSVRGANKRLSSGTTGSEDTNFTYGYTSSFDADGFTTTAGATDNENWNTTGESFVAWNWKAGNSAGSSNTAGSITSTVSANPTAGFSVVTYTGNNTLSTIGHGLGASPKFIIVKTRSGNDNWVCYHGSLGVQYYTLLNTTASSYNNLSDYWSATAPSSSVFGINAYGGVNTNGATYVAYCWAEVAGFSKFGSYTGNGSADGTFVHLGFRPRYVVWKKSNVSGGHWGCIDSARNPYNLANLSQLLNAADADATNVQTLDLLSNGFKVRTSDAGQNSNGDTFIYMAFAENPFKNSLAR